MKVKTGIYLLIITFLLCIAAPLSWSHSGPIDSSNGHVNGQTGVYHYHKGKSLPTSKYSRLRKPSSTYHSVKKEGTVYVTRTGERYHSAGCRYLGKDPVPLDIKDAQKLSFMACSFCEGRPTK